MNSEKRTKSIKIRVTEDELLALNALKNQAGFSMLAEYMRTVSLGLDIQNRKEYPLADPELQRQLSGIGNNMNQIARYLNSSEMAEVNVVKVISFLSSIDRSLDKIRDNWSIPDAR
ncbi:MobC family plasmid mobilization relaxosome protein [Pseudoalteromonas sp. CAL260-MNA-CIBAN-0059]|jgi:hypothetical protein|uniref:MobC family plasmid mobilization relaxosome protein n=1 Tax=Pseudoalteromonas sp. CAL260-MNA-CIBAN-0059 TaxID=3140430 RepID=UPI00332CA1A3